ncbi:MAG: acyltransferase [Cystobacter sp.]
MRYPGLDLLRAIAIVWVMLFHTYLIGGLGPDWSWLSRFGWMGVDLFFVLSGFLIGQQVLPPLAQGGRLDFGDFYLRRAFRVLPAFWVVLALYALFPSLRERPGLEPLWKFATFLFNVTADYSNSAFSQVWSLCVEEHFYLVFPVLALWLTGRIQRRELLWLCAGIVLTGITLRSSIWLTDAQREGLGLESGNWFVEDIYYPTWNRLDGLLAGVMLAVARVWRQDAWNRLQRHANAVLAAGILLLGAAMWLFRDRVGLTGNALGWPVLSAAMALLVFAGAGTTSVIGRWSVPGAEWVSLTSYSLYLVHKIAFGQVQTHLTASLEGRPWLAVATYAAATLLAGAVLHYAIERPFLQLRGRLLRVREPKAALASV